MGRKKKSSLTSKKHYPTRQQREQKLQTIAGCHTNFTAVVPQDHDYTTPLQEPTTAQATTLQRANNYTSNFPAEANQSHCQFYSQGSAVNNFSQSPNLLELEIVSSCGSNTQESLVEVPFPSNEITVHSSELCENASSSQLVTPPRNMVMDSPPAINFIDSLNAISGKHIVDLGHVIQQTVLLMKNACCNHKDSQLLYVSEKRTGLISNLKFQCTHCGAVKFLSTNKISENMGRPSPTVDDKHVLTLNDLAVWAFASIGGGHANLDEALSVMEIHPMSQTTFLRHEQKINQIYDREISEEILKAGKEERDLAIQNGDVTQDGIVFIRVIVDATFSKRSYGHAFNAKSACGVIIGARTKKLLFMGVRNKYCCVCSLDQRKGIEIRKHKCFRNWDGTTSAMEADMIVEGFLKSESMHNLQYRCIIGDGDSSVYEKVQTCVPYGMFVQKIECANHVVKNYTKRLYKLQQKSSENKRCLPKYKIDRLKRGIRGAIIHGSQELQTLISKGDADMKTVCWNLTKELKADLLNVAHHAFNSHQKCRDYFCDKLDKEDEYCKLSKELQCDLQVAVQPVVDMASSILENETSNLAEYCMSLIAKAVGGKQINRSQKGIYEARARIAGMQFQKGRDHHYQTMKNYCNVSPASPVKRHGLRIKRRLFSAKKSLQKKLLEQSTEGVKKRKPDDSVKKYNKCPNNSDYGPRAQRPDISIQEMEYRKIEKLKSLQVTKETQQEIERATVGQSENEEWHKERKHRLTASNFGPVACKRSKTPCEKLVKKVIYTRNLCNLDSIRHGKECEPKAITKYEERTGKVVKKCGLFVDLKNGFLGASPDGIIEEEGLIEVKCPYSARDMTIQEATQKIKNFYLKCTQDKLALNRNHAYFYQIQGQLHICDRNYCDFVVYTFQDIYIERIFRDNAFWEKIEPRLETFYRNCLLPEIVDSRHSRSMPIREPPSFAEA